MALHRSGSSRSSRTSSSAGDKDGEASAAATDEMADNNNGYIQIFVKPLEQGDYSVLLGWLGLSNVRLSRQQVGLVVAGGAAVVVSLIYQLLVADLGSLFYRLAALLMPVFAIASAFFWLALYLRDLWSTTSVYVLFVACFFGEFIGQCLVDSASGAAGVADPNPSAAAGDDVPPGVMTGSVSETFIARPLLALIVLLAVSAASVFSSLDTSHSSGVIAFVSVIRFLSATTLGDLPQCSRPFLAYLAGLTGVIGAKYMETLFRPPVTNYVTNEGKIPVIKRRRSSSSAMHGFCTPAQRAGRRTSLPALIHSKSQSSTASYEAALISEAHGLITDMLVDSNLPPHVVGGLRAVSNLLKPPDTHVPGHTKPKVSPLVSLAESTNYGSDTEDLPYTGERPSSLPKRLRRSLPPSLIRRMSTSTWTTTTSATGMPTLEAEPCRTRSSSFRHSRDNTPGSSPVGSRSNSPSPSSPTTISLTIPKSRSFSLASPGLTAGSALGATSGKRALRERRSIHVVPCSDSSGLLSPVKGDHALTPTSPVSASSADMDAGPASPGIAAMDRNKPPSSPRSPAKAPSSVSSLTRRLNVTSDYDSSDSPGNSDHSDSVAADDVRSSVVSGSGPRSPANRRKVTLPGPLTSTDSNGTTSQLQTQPETSEQGSSSETTESISLGSNNTIDSVASLTLSEQHSQIPTVSLQAQDSVDNRTDLLNDCDQSDEKDSDNMLALPYELELIRDNELLNTNLLNQWDYPIFDIADQYTDTVLSQVSYKIFLETGLFETFRIPIPEFLNYFHALELGYREKPYHNRVHATDVLHGVYYLTTQPIPGFDQVNPNESELLCKQTGSSSESDSELSEKAVVHRPSFTAEETYGIMGGNFPALELMALYTAAAMHDYDHPGRTNAFLVTTHSSLAVLYNDRSVLESHHAASAWELLLSSPAYNWIQHLEKGEFKRFRYLVIEAILATDLKRHFEMVAEFNAKVNDEDAPGIDWTNETDRLQCSSMVIKLADINGPTKRKDLHVDWTNRITEEFYEQGDEEAGMGLPISPYMDRENPQLAKLQESFINHLVAPLLNCLGAAGMLPGTWEEDDDDAEDDDSDKDESSTYKDTEDEETDADSGKSPVSSKRRSKKRIHCWLTKNLEDNHAMWVVVIKRETAAKEREAAGNGLPPPRSPLDNEGQVTHLEPIQLPPRSMSVGEKEMESIKEEDTPPNSANSLKEEDHRRASLPVLRQTEHHSVTFAQPTVIEPDTCEARPLNRDQPLVSCLSPSSKKHEIPSSQQSQPTTTHQESSESSLQPKTLLDERDTETDSTSRNPSGQGSLSQLMEMTSSVPRRTSSQ